MTQADISEETKARARLGVAKATQLEFENQPVGPVSTVIGSLRDSAKTILEWLLTFVSFLLPVALLLLIVPRLLLKSERSLELVDLSVPGGSPPANRELTQELQDVIDRIRGALPGSAKLDASGFGDSVNEDGGALPAPDLVFVTPAVDAPELAKQLDAFVSSTPAITLSGIALNPLQLWALIKRLMTRRARHAFIGTLTTYDNTLTLRLTREDRLFGRKTEWRSSAPMASAEARISCLVDIASRIVLDGQNTSTATSDCHSLKEYILGLYALGTANTPDALKAASAHFQAALDRDEDNWLARFQLALCARGRKDTRTAIRHLMWFAGQEAAASTSLQKHIERHPDFPYVVQYQLASTRSLASEDREEPEVGRMLDGLIALETSAEGKTLDRDPEKRLRLVMLARSGQSTRDAMRCSLERHDQVIREARQRLREHLNWFDKHADALQRAAPTGHPLARGIVLHAYGRILFSGGDRRGAIERLSEATDLMPTYADVHVDLAKAYLEHKGKSDWPQQVTRLLRHALELDPENAKAKFVYARFYFAEETRDYAKAEPYLTAAPFDPASLFMLAQVLNDRGSYADTLGVLERAIALQEQGPPFRVRLYADSLLELVKIANDPSGTIVPKPNLRALERARRRLCAVRQRQALRRQRTNAEELSAGVRDLRRDLRASARRSRELLSVRSRSPACCRAAEATGPDACSRALPNSRRHDRTRSHVETRPIRLATIEHVPQKLNPYGRFKQTAVGRSPALVPRPWGRPVSSGAHRTPHRAHAACPATAPTLSRQQPRRVAAPAAVESVDTFRIRPCQASRYPGTRCQGGIPGPLRVRSRHRAPSAPSPRAVRPASPSCGRRPCCHRRSRHGWRCEARRSAEAADVRRRRWHRGILMITAVPCPGPSL